MMDDELKKKFQEYQALNESRLEDVALTFSLEGVKRDLKGFIQKKISFNVRVMEHFSNMLGGLAAGDKAVVRDIIRDKDSPINSMIDHLLNESRVVNNILNTTIFGLLNQENLLSTADGPSESPKGMENRKENEETNINTKNLAESE